MNTLINDIKFGIRKLVKNPGFTTVAILTLALAIGSNSAIFTLINAVMLRPVPGIQAPQKLALVTDGGSTSLGYPLFERLRDGGHSFSGMFATTGLGRCQMIVTGEKEAQPEPIQAQVVSQDFFPILGVEAALGRILMPADHRLDVPQAVAVISFGFWQRRFNRDPAVVGKSVIIEEIPMTIVGVATESFSGFEAGTTTDLWCPIQMYPQLSGWGNALTSEGSWWLKAVGRLKPEATRRQARAELDVIFTRFLTEQAEKWGTSPEEWQKHFAHRHIKLFSAGTGSIGLRNKFQRPLLVLMMIVGLVLLVACANLAGLLLARGLTRQREFSIQAALGANRGTLMRQLIMESLLLAGAGGALGLLLAQWGVRLLALYLPDYGRSVHLTLTPDGRVLAFTFIVSGVTGLIFGLVPAWRGTGFGLVTSLKEQAGSVTQQPFGQFWNKALIVTQIALSCCLLIGAGLFVRTVHKLKTLDVGFERRNLLAFKLDMSSQLDESRRAGLYDDILRRVEHLPGVVAVSCSSLRSSSGSEMGWGPTEVAPESQPDKILKVRGTGVGLDYFKTMQIPLLRGRSFGRQDAFTRDSDPASLGTRPVIIDQTTARTLFGQTNPLGKLLLAGGRKSVWPTMQVIGVVGDVIHKGLRRGKRITLYGYETQHVRALPYFCARTVGPPLQVAESLRRAVQEVDPTIAVTDLHTVNEFVDQQILQERTLSHLGSVFSLAALALACLGLYGILSFQVARRTREIGVRMALGAQAKNLIAVILRQGMSLTLVGYGVGIVLSLVLMRFVASMLYGVVTTDPVTLACVGIVVTAVSMVACLIPALRAARVDPMEALRYE